MNSTEDMKTTASEPISENSQPNEPESVQNHTSDSGQEIRFAVQVTPEIIKDFLTYNTYHCTSGILSIVAGAISIGGTLLYLGKGDTAKGLIFLLFALLFLVYPVIGINIKSKAQYNKISLFHKPLNFLISNEGIFRTQDTREDIARWSEVSKVVMTKNNIIIYIGSARVFLFPLKDIQDQLQLIVKTLKKNTPQRNFKIKIKYQ